MMTVTAETVGTVPVNAVLDLTEALRALRGPDGRPLEFLWTGATPSPSGASIRWAGEWTTTYELFRDLGGAFAIVIFLLYVMMVGWYQSFVTPLVVMLPIPLSLLGVIPAHALFGMPLTGMAVVGVIALAGLMVRNSILLVDFARANIDRGLDVAEATLDAAQTRLRPIVLTGATVVLGDGMLFFDPLLQGLGLAMAFGALASTALTLGVVPVASYQLSAWRGARAGVRPIPVASPVAEVVDEPRAVDDRLFRPGCARPGGARGGRRRRGAPALPTDARRVPGGGARAQSETEGGRCGDRRSGGRPKGRPGPVWPGGSTRGQRRPVRRAILHRHSPLNPRRRGAADPGPRSRYGASLSQPRPTHRHPLDHRRGAPGPGAGGTGGEGGAGGDAQRRRPRGGGGVRPGARGGAHAGDRRRGSAPDSKPTSSRRGSSSCKKWSPAARC